MALGVTEANWGDWSIDRKVFNFIRKILPSGRTILELGSGWATGELAEYYTMYSVEHDLEYVNKYKSTYIYAPLKKHKAIQNHRHTVWYDADILRWELPKIKYDLVLVDGPPCSRSGLVKYIDLFDPTAIWIFDDAQRDAEAKVVNSIASRLDVPWVTYQGSTGKTFSVMNSPLLTPFLNEEI
jgi:hypothetical protein